MYLGLIVLATSSFLGTVLGELETVYQWRYIDYTWPSKAKRQEAIRTGDYNISRPLPMDFALSQDGRMFMTIVSVDGVPARLGVITNRTGVDSGPLIRPYPSWGWTDKKSCGAIHKPYRIQIDRCNRLWVLDSSHNALDRPRECHPKLLAFNLWTDTLIYNITIPENIATNAQTNLTLLTNVIVDTYGPYCEHTTVYMADSLGNGLVIWDGARLYRIDDPTFVPQPEATNFTSGTDTSNEPVGILGIDLSPRIFPNERQYLYYRPMASFGLFAVSTDQLKEAAIEDDTIVVSAANNILKSQSIAHAFSSKGTLFLSSVEEMSLVCWNRYRKLSKRNIVTVAQDRRLDYINAIHVIPWNIWGEEEVWVMSNRLIRHDPRRGNRSLWNTKEINYRILKSPVRELVAGTSCEIPFVTFP